MGGKYTTASSEPPSDLSQQRCKGTSYHSSLYFTRILFLTNIIRMRPMSHFPGQISKVVSTLEHYQIAIKVVNIQIYYRRYSIFMIIDHDPCLALFALPKSNFGFNSIEGYCWIIMYTLLYAKIGIGLGSFILFFHQWTQLCLQGKFSECLLKKQIHDESLHIDFLHRQTSGQA